MEPFMVKEIQGASYVTRDVIELETKDVVEAKKKSVDGDLYALVRHDWKAGEFKLVSDQEVSIDELGSLPCKKAFCSAVNVEQDGKDLAPLARAVYKELFANGIVMVILLDELD